MIKKELIDLYVQKYGYRIAAELAKTIVNELPLSGEKWTLEASKALGDRFNIDWKSIPLSEWYLVLNAMYAQHKKTAVQYGLDDLFFASLATDWFTELNATERKTFNHFMYQ